MDDGNLFHYDGIITTRNEIDSYESYCSVKVELAKALKTDKTIVINSLSLLKNIEDREDAL
jgi:hypothetical protein